MAIAWYWDTYAPFAVSVVVAPLLLLRTRGSTAYGIRLARRATRWHAIKIQPTAGNEIFGLLLTLLGPFHIRIWATVVYFFRDFCGCLRAIPPNWLNLVGSMDSSVAPQPIPGFRGRYITSATVSNLWDLRAFTDLIRHLKTPGDARDSLEFTLAFTIFFVCVFLPALLYRWSLKSTFWIYLPLLWVVAPARAKARGLWVRVEAVKNNRWILAASAGVIGLWLVKLRLWQVQAGIFETLDQTTIGPFISAYVEPDSMPVWQYAGALNGALAIGMYVFACAAVQARDEQDPWPETVMDTGLRVMTMFRRLLTTYTTAVLVMITVKQGFPPLGEFLPV